MDTVAGVLAIILLVVLVLDLAIRTALTWRRRGSDRVLARRRAQERAEVLFRELLTDAEYAELGHCGCVEARNQAWPPGSVPNRGGSTTRRHLAIVRSRTWTEREDPCLSNFERWRT